MNGFRTIDEIRDEVETRFALTLMAERGMDTPGSRSWNRHQAGALRLYLRREGWNRWIFEGACVGGIHALLHLAATCQRDVGRLNVAYTFGSHQPAAFIRPYPEQRDTGIGYLDAEETQALTTWYATTEHARRSGWVSDRLYAMAG